MTYPPLTLTPYERFMWQRLAATSRLWRADPNQVSGANLQKAARVVKASCAMPFADEDERHHQLWAILEWGPKWMELTLEERNQAWPELVAGLAAIDVATARPTAPSGAPSPVAEPPAASPWYLQD